MAKKIKYKLGQRPKYKDGGIVDENGILNIIKPKGNDYTENVATTIYKDYDETSIGRKKYNKIPARARKENIDEIVTESLRQNVNPYLALAISDDETTIGSYGNEIYGMDGNNTALYHTNPEKPKIPELAGRSEARGKLGVKAVKASVDYGKTMQRQGVVPQGEDFTLQAFQGYGHMSKANAELQGVMRGKPIPAEGINFKKTPYTGQRLVDKRNAFRNNPEYKNSVDSLTLEHLKPVNNTPKIKFENGGYSQDDNDTQAAWGTGLSSFGSAAMAGSAMTGPAAPFVFVGGAVASIAGSLLTGDAQKDAAANQIAKQNAITKQNEETAMKANLASQSTNQSNFANKTPINSFYAKRGGMFKRQFANGGGLKQVASDSQIAYGATHEQGGVDAGSVEVEGGGKIGNQPGEVIKQDFVYSDSMDMSLDGKTTPADIAQQLTLKKGNIEKGSGKATEVIQGIRQRLTSSPSQLRSNTALREADAKQTKILKGEQQIAMIDAQLEQLKQGQIAKGVQMGIYAEDGTPIDQLEQQPEARRGGNFKPKYELAGRLPYSMLPNSPLRPYRDVIVNNSDIPFNPNLNLPVEITNNIPNNVPEYINYADAKQAMQGVINSPQPVIQPAQPIGTPKASVALDTKGVVPNGTTPVAGKWSAQDTSTAMNAGAGLISAGVNFYNNRELAKQYANLKNPTYVPIVAQQTGTIDYAADKNEALRNAKSYTRSAEQNSANTQGSLIAKQFYANRAQDRIDQYSQAERTANVGIRDANANRQLQVDQINQQGLLASQNADFARAHSNITNIGNTNAALSSDIKDTFTNYRKDQKDQQILNLEAMKNPKSIQDAMLEQIRLQNKGLLPVRKLGGKVKRNVIK